MSDAAACDAWKLSENLCLLYAVFKVMTEEQRNIVTVSSKEDCEIEDIGSEALCLFIIDEWKV
jgi:hypothetical protein